MQGNSSMVPSLFELTSRWIRANLLSCSSPARLINGLPNLLLKQLVAECTFEQLLRIELKVDRDLGIISDDLWKSHCFPFVSNNVDIDSWKPYYKELFRKSESERVQKEKRKQRTNDIQTKGNYKSKRMKKCKKEAVKMNSLLEHQHQMLAAEPKPLINSFKTNIQASNTYFISQMKNNTTNFKFIPLQPHKKPEKQKFYYQYPHFYKPKALK